MGTHQSTRNTVACPQKDVGKTLLPSETERLQNVDIGERDEDVGEMVLLSATQKK